MLPKTQPKMRIDIWSDVVCPFCYIGETSLRAALQEAGVAAEITHRAFRLQPGAPVEKVEDMLARKYGLRGAEAQAQQKRVTDMAASVGLDFHLDKTLSGDTFDAHRLLALAADQGADLLSVLYRAYFTDGENVFERETLFKLGEAAGLKRADMQAALNSDDIAARVTADEQLARQIGVQGVPFVVLDGRLAVSGAQPAAVFIDALRQAQAAAHNQDQTDMAGPACGPDGCAE